MTNQHIKVITVNTVVNNVPPIPETGRCRKTKLTVTYMYKSDDATMQTITIANSHYISGLDPVDRPDWYFPDGTVEMGFSSGGGDIYQHRGSQRNRRRNNVLSPSGIYRCEIPTDDGDGGFMRETVYVGIYGSGGIDTVL